MVLKVRIHVQLPHTLLLRVWLARPLHKALEQEKKICSLPRSASLGFCKWFPLHLNKMSFLRVLQVCSHILDLGEPFSRVCFKARPISRIGFAYSKGVKREIEAPWVFFELASIQAWENTMVLPKTLPPTRWTSSANDLTTSSNNCKRPKQILMIIEKSTLKLPCQCTRLSKSTKKLTFNNSYVTKVGRTTSLIYRTNYSPNKSSTPQLSSKFQTS